MCDSEKHFSFFVSLMDIKDSNQIKFRSPKELAALGHKKLISIVQDFQRCVDPARAKKVARFRRKKDRPVNWEKFSIRHVAFKVVYFGWDYQGLVIQKDVENTIEARLMDAFIQCKLLQDPDRCHWTRCGRTDKGVSAFSQTISLHVRSNVKEGVGIIRAGSLVKDGNEEHNYLKVLI